MARILLIDDEDLVRQTARTVLEYAGHTVTEFANGKHGLTWLETNTADVLLTDMLMPDTDGIEIIREARKRHPALRIVAMSGSRQHELYLQAAGKLGAHAIVDKPFRAKQLSEVIRLVLAGPAAPATP